MKPIRLLAAALCMTGILLLPACATLTVEEYAVPDAPENIGSGVLAENDTYTLEWDDEVRCALLRDRATGYVWSTTPYGAYTEESSSMALNSSLIIEYYDLTDLSEQTEQSFVCVQDGTTSTEKVENGVRVTYYFPQAEITVPMTLTLEERGLRVTVVPSEVVESGKTRLISMSVVPYLCSAAKTEDHSAYLMIPAGSGALMYTDEDLTANGRAFAGEVYGVDAARPLLNNVENEQLIHLPVFGAKTDADHALFAVIDKGAEAAWIQASAGVTRYDYANAYARFLFRGYDEVEYGSRWEAKGLSATCSPDAVYSVCYYPLNGGEADYNGMARFYRAYLEEKGLLTASTLTQQSYQLSLVGGAETKQFFLGVPYERVLSLTSWKQAQTVIGEMADATGKTPAVLLRGYGESGVSIRKVGGGFGFSRAMGSGADRRALFSFCNENEIPFFINYELTAFTKSGEGFSAAFDTAKTALLRGAAVYPIKTNLRMPDDSLPKLRLLKREKLASALRKLLKSLPDGTQGVGLGDLGATAYSDYSREETYLKGNTQAQTREMIAAVREAGYPTALRAANDYAAGAADTVTETPLGHGGYTAFDETIPFYAMVFRGSVPLYSTPLNYESDPHAALLRAVEAGISPAFELIAEHPGSLSERGEYFYAMEYDGQKDNACALIAESAQVYDALAGAHITAHHLLGGNLTRTEYDNGVTVTVNHGDTPQAADGQTVPAGGFLLTGENQ